MAAQSLNCPNCGAAASSEATRCEHCNSRLATVAEWAEPNRKGVVAYVDDAGKARGFLLWDVWGKVDASRELISAGAVVGAEDLRALLA